jgi:hypothetical protein
MNEITLYKGDCLIEMKKNRKNKQLFIGRRFGKTGMLYHTIVDSLSISTEMKKELHDQYEKALRGEE